MSLTLIYKKLQELKEKEKKIQDFYDPVKIHKTQHPHIQDLRDDYKEDIQNYGFSRFALKQEQEASEDDGDRMQSGVVTSPYKHLSQKQNGTDSQAHSLKPLSTQLRPTTAKPFISSSALSNVNTISNSKTIQSIFTNSLRPQTATITSKQGGPSSTRNVKSAQQKNIHWGVDSINDRLYEYDEDHEEEEHHQQNQSTFENSSPENLKHWKFTKKYDTSKKLFTKKMRKYHF